MSEAGCPVAELEAEVVVLRARVKELEALHSGVPSTPASAVEMSRDQLLDQIPLGLAVLSPSLEWLSVNQRLCEIAGLERDELLGLRWPQIASRYRIVRPRDLVRRLIGGEPGPFTLEATCRMGDARICQLEVQVRRVCGQDLAPGSLLVSVRDVTVRTEAMSAARQSAAFLRQVIDLIPHFVFAKDEEGRFLLANRAVAEAYGTTPIVILGKKDSQFTATDDEVGRFRADDLEVMRSGSPLLVPEEAITDASGRKRLLQTTKIPFRFGANLVPGVLGVSVDVTSLRSAEKELQRRTAELDQFFEIALDLLCIADTSGRFRRVNREWECTLGYSRGELEGTQFLDLVHPDDVEATLAAIQQLAEQRQVLGFVNRYRCKDGSYRFIEWRSAPAGELIFAAARDITLHMESESSLRASQHMLEDVLNHFPGVVFWKDLDSVYLGCNRAFAHGAGLGGPDEIVGKTDLDLPWASTEGDAYRADDHQVMSTGRSKAGIVEPQLQADGSVIWFNTTKIPLTRADGRVIGVLGVSADITAMRKLEEQYRQAQKMEAVGQLAGGVAHDFNNILQIITGYTEVAQLRVSAGRHPTGELEEIGRAAARASDLVRQLLALSRQQSMRRQSLNLNGLITGLGAMLRRLIEERVELRTTCRGPLPAVYADPAQIEQVVVNLCVNARDAMPQGGVLRLETRGEDLTPESCLRLSGVRPGRFVVLVVSDTGTGIPPENVDRVFEPFFTTKQPGKGTGLGLSTVYGIVSQHGGFIEVDTVVGQGTTFRVHLPSADTAPVADNGPGAVAELASGGCETILVTEDEEQVRNLAVEVLRDAGYRVLVAEDGEEALSLLETCGEDVDLYLLDAVLPKLSGRAVRDAILARYPAARILFCTGHTFETLGAEGLDEADLAVLWKPFPPRVLLQRVRQALDA